MKYLDKVAIIEYESIHRTNTFKLNVIIDYVLNGQKTFVSLKAKRHSPYAYFGDILILCIIKFFRDNLELLNADSGKEQKTIG